ncbi:MAG: DUF202 domain-containing protein [Ignavibacteria bacterium]|nr:DUF202 domain-containing protein [Ignavibacteria bacterium]
MKDANELAAERTDLAYERTALANDRTLMAWIRTAVSLVSFGFTLYKFLHEFREAEHLERSDSVFTPRIVGMVLIALGFLGLLFAYFQYRLDMKRLSSYANELPKSFTPYFAILILLFSMMLFFAAMFRY